MCCVRHHYLPSGQLKVIKALLANPDVGKCLPYLQGSRNLSLEDRCNLFPSKLHSGIKVRTGSTSWEALGIYKISQ